MFYTRPGPDKEPFVQPGDHIEAGAAVGIVEVMKQFTEIRSENAGTVVSINVADGGTVTPGEVLVVVDD
ncbi:biotin/lipoyl-containing protein [Amycolatopsis sp. NPDC023774]|uniref:biotin/lipoyl-containing protein n=1 Tax=Amycolatopsis sp. NPDC023774 TaxID=3155015 RepID=UPI0033E3CBFE